MKLSRLWLNDFVSVQVNDDTLISQLNMAGLEVDAVHPVAATFTGVVVGEVLETHPHPNASKLTCCLVEVSGDEPLAIICGAPNVRSGLKVAVAKIGALLPGDFKIKKAKLRGEPSFGMLCSASELGIDLPSEGILELPKDAPVGQDIREYLQLDDKILELDLTPNRGDCLSALGLAREVAALNNCSIQVPSIEPVKHTIDDVIDVSVDASNKCPHYVGRVIKGIDISCETPLWIKERLRRSGINCRSIVVDVTNYVMLELGQPMHAFDAAKITGKINVREAHQGEELTLLDEQELKLHPGSLVICDEGGPLALAGVMGGLDSSVTDATHNIFLESAFFIPDALAGQARVYGLATDSSHRFERGVALPLQKLAIERATSLLLQFAGGEAGPVVQVGSDEMDKKAVLLNIEKANRILGLQLSASEMIELLSRLEMTAQITEEGILSVIPPAYRFDISIEVDLVEEIARLYGYDNIPMHDVLSAGTSTYHSELKRDEESIRDLLVTLGYHETISYSFINAKAQSTLYDVKIPVSLVNPLSEDLGTMRHGLLTGLLNTVKFNQSRQCNHLRIFETGMCFFQEEDVLTQKNMVAGVVVGKRFEDDWLDETRQYDFYDIKGDVCALLQPMLSAISFQKPQKVYKQLHPGVSAEILINGDLVGYVGKLHPLASKFFDITGNAFVFELDLAAISNKRLPCYKKVSKYPGVRRDLSFLIDEGVLCSDIRDVIYANKTDILQDIIIFDVYQGDNIASGKKSIALGLILQDSSRTLLDEDVNNFIGAILEELRQRFDIILRDNK